MVIKDLFEDASFQNQTGPAPYLDRFFASVIDFLILAPMVSLFCGGITNDLRWSFFSRESDGVYSLVFQYMFITFALFVLYEVMFTYFHGATPGHRFLYMRVVDQKGKNLSLTAALFRSIFKFQAILLAGIPFVEIALRPDRSTFYDRASQSRLVSLRPTRSDDIHPEFRIIILRWTNISIIFFFLMVGMFFYKTVATPTSEKMVKAKSKCTESLAFYLKNYLSKSRETENLNCSKELVEKSFKSKHQMELNYLAQFVITSNEELKDLYRKKYCVTRPEKLICQDMATANFDEMKPDTEDILNLLVEMNLALTKNDHGRVFTIIDSLYNYVDWNKNLELFYLTSYVFLTEQGSRSPASEKKAKSDWDAKKARFLKRMNMRTGAEI